MGLQDVLDVALIRHAYVSTIYRNQGIGGQLLAEVRTQTRRPLLVGTWAAARWAIRFYEKHGFRLVSARRARIGFCEVLVDPGAAGAGIGRAGRIRSGRWE